MIIDDVPRKVIIIAPCLLNHSLVACGFHNKKGIEIRFNFLKKLINLCEKYYISIDTYPCPETSAYGVPRPPSPKEVYDRQIKKIKKNAYETIKKIKYYLKKDISVIAIITIDGSPCCGVNFTKSGKVWSKNELLYFYKNYKLNNDIPYQYYKQLKHIEGKGTFIELLLPKIEKINKEMNKNIKIIGWSLQKEDEILQELENLIKENLKQKIQS